MKSNVIKLIALICLLIGGSKAFASAEIKLAGVFTDNMVLQREMQVPVWGWSGPGEKILVKFAGQSKTATADASGRWLVKLDSMTASSESRALQVGSVTTTNEIEITNVLVGEVWLATGQSNMGIPLSAAPYGKTEAAQANHPDFRYRVVTTGVAEEPQRELPVARHPELQKQPKAWVVCSPATAPVFSGVAYFFGLELQERLRVPVGILRSSVGGTPIEAWISRDALQSTPAGRDELAEWSRKVADPKADRVAYDEENRKAKETAKAHHKGPPEIFAYQEPAISTRRPANLYNAMIAPIAPFAFRGVIWYQGESNTRPIARAQEYHELFASMIRDWRKLWGREFVFLFVQLPNFHGGDRVDWPALRESQAKTLSLPKTGMAVAIDAGLTSTIHPPDKKPVGHRLVLQALKQAYDQPVLADGPFFSGVKFKGVQEIISFKNETAGLVSKSGENLSGFTVAGADRKFFPASAMIQGNEVVVSCAQVAKPVAVRYCFINSAEASLFDRNGLPAAPFRTDDWPLADVPE